ncbi:MAG TPA: alpha/beta hydrolase [Steroidobacteraceae bacterium]|nr:alpha/beta hydrolase [Steroidobacteraceae bacterium]
MRGSPRRWWCSAAWLLLAWMAFSGVRADNLPRKAGSQGESYPGVRVAYDFVRDDTGRRLRLILTHPEASRTRFATIFVVGWLSCDSVEAPRGTTDATQLLFRSLAQLPGFATVRMDKAGVGDSEGDCAATDFLSELEAYRRAFRTLASRPFVDMRQVFLFGISNGGGFAPLVPEGVPVRGYVIDGGWLKTWYEHMLEIERRRLVLEGHPDAEINTLMTSVARLYASYLLERQPPRQIFAVHPEWRALWQGDAAHQYGRPVAYYQQLQDLNLMAAWSAVKVPALILHGEFDWIMSRSDLETMATLVNRNTPGAAELVELPATGHSFDRYGSLHAAFAGEHLPFDPLIAQRIGAWLERQRQ